MSPAIARFEQRLLEEAERFAQGLRLYLGEEPGQDPVCPRLAERVGQRQFLAAEDARLRRQARRGAPSYDLNRPIAIRRLLQLWSSL